MLSNAFQSCYIKYILINVGASYNFYAIINAVFKS